MRLRYTGQIPVSFMNMPDLGEVEPGVFDAPDEAVPTLLLHGHIQSVEADDDEPAEPDTPAPTRPRKASTPKAPEASQPAVTETTTTA